MTDHIRIRMANGEFVIRANGITIGETSTALELTEGGGRTVMCFPRADLAMAAMDRSTRQSTCPRKGSASSNTLSIESGTIRDIAWSYETPQPGVADIAGHLSFYPDKVAFEQL